MQLHVPLCTYAYAYITHNLMAPGTMHMHVIMYAFKYI